MSTEMLINVSEGEECRIALVENGRLEELYVERTSSTSHVGNIYKGRVTNVEPSIQAAFIDFGLGRNGFLHISDLMPSYFGHGGEDVQETVGRKMSRRDRPPIQRCLKRGDDIVVQIIKEGIGTKGPTLSTYLSIPGRIIVMMPGMAKMGVSRKIEDEPERRRLRQILDSLEPPKDVGFIIRTAGVGKTKAEIQRDLVYLTRLWQSFVKKRDSGPGPMELYTEGDLVSRTVRDVFTSDVDRIILDNKEVAKRIREVVKLANPRTRNKIELHEEPIPLFHKFGIESQIELMHSRHVPLPSGGSLVIDSTEAVVAIDVNSGKFREHNDAELTAFKTDMEAADEIPRQLRLRDLGGVIICDFIDLRFDRHRRELENRLHQNFQNDRAKTRVLRMSQFGIIEITRQRMRPSLKRSIYSDCPHCKGAGLVKTPESMSLDVMRRLAIAANDARVVRVQMSVCAEVESHLQNRKRAAIADLERHFNKPILIKVDQTLSLDDVKLELFDARDGLVYLAELGMSPQPALAAPLPAGGGRGGRQDGRRDGRQGGRPDDRNRRPGGDQRRNEPQRGRPSGRDEEEDIHSIDRVEQEVEDREEEIDRGSEIGERPMLESVQPPGLPDNLPHVGPMGPGAPGSRGPIIVSAPPAQSPQDDADDGEFSDDGFNDGAEDNGGQSDSGISDSGPGEGGPGDGGLGDEGGPRRRRRRRRRRGRGGGGGGINDGAGTGAGAAGSGGPPPFNAEFDDGGQPDLVAPNAAGSDEGSPGNSHLDDTFDNRGNQRSDNRGPRRSGYRPNDRYDRRNDARFNQNRPAPAGNRRPDDRRPDDRRPDNRRPDNRRPDDRRPNDRRPDNRRADNGYQDNRYPANRNQVDRNRDNQNRNDRDRDDRGLEGQEQAVGEGFVEDYDTGEPEPTAIAPVTPPPALPEPQSPPAIEEPPEEIVQHTPQADAPSPRRSRRGGKGRRRGGAAGERKSSSPNQPPSEIEPASESPAEVSAAKPSRRKTAAKGKAKTAAAARPRRKPPAKAEAEPTSAGKEKAVLSQQPIVRTGSADRHLASDEPVAPIPVTRPHSFRDLDVIPDDFD